MAKEDIDSFFDAVRNEPTLAKEFAKAVADTARNNGFDVDEQDVLDQFGGDDTPSTRPLPDDGPRLTTMALGEEGGRDRLPPPKRRESVTLAIGEEDKKSPPSGDVTSAALGEEEGRGRRTTAKPGEEDKRPPSRPITTMAVGEEGRKPRP
ncbi:MAG: Nif11-like leader peptide family natural product precursor [Alphaproteobacteria bacterium]